MSTETRPMDAVLDSVYTTSKTMVSAPPPPFRSTEAAVGGGRRYAHHHHYQPRRPHVAFQRPEIILAPTAAGVDPTIPYENDHSTKDAGVQTMYRESESQTDPFTPQYSVDPAKETPEVLLLEGMTFKDGFSIRENEIRMLELARRRRIIEASLPPTTDEASVALRAAVLGDLEHSEVKARECDIDKFQESRLHSLAVALAERDRAEAFHTEMRIDLLRQGTQSTLEKARTETTQKRLSMLRKLDTARAHALPRRLMQGTKNQSDIIQKLSKPSSSAYVPLRRDGISTNRNDARFSTERVVAALEEPEQLRDFVISIPKNSRRAIIPQPRVVSLVSQKSKGKQNEMSILHCIETLKKTFEQPKSTRIMTDKTKTRQAEESQRLRRTPKADFVISEEPPPPEENDRQQHEIDLALIILQRLLRGRATQNMMFMGKQEQLKLIRELRSRADIDSGTRVRDGSQATSDTVAGVAIASILVEKSESYQEVQ